MLSLPLELHCFQQLIVKPNLPGFLPSKKFWKVKKKKVKRKASKQFLLFCLLDFLFTLLNYLVKLKTRLEEGRRNVFSVHSHCYLCCAYSRNSFWFIKPWSCHDNESWVHLGESPAFSFTFPIFFGKIPLHRVVDDLSHAPCRWFSRQAKTCCSFSSSRLEIFVKKKRSGQVSIFTRLTLDGARKKRRSKSDCNE